MADDGHMGAKLVLPAGDGLERDEGDVLPGPVDHGVMRHRRLRHLLLARTRLPHPVALGALRLDQRRLDLALVRLGHAADQRPIDLPHRAGLESAAELRRDGAALGHDQHARGVAVEPVHEPRPCLGPVAQGFEQAVDMMRRLGSALHGDARRLVEDEEVVVLVEGDRREKIAVGLRQAASWRWRRRDIGQRRHADSLAVNEPRARLSARAIDPDLPRPQQLLEPAVGKLRVMGLEPAVEAHPVFTGRDVLRLDARHG
jgi:hypothetical protein